MWLEIRKTILQYMLHVFLFFSSWIYITESECSSFISLWWNVKAEKALLLFFYGFHHSASTSWNVRRTKLLFSRFDNEHLWEFTGTAPRPVLLWSLWSPGQLRPEPIIWEQRHFPPFMYASRRSHHHHPVGQLYPSHITAPSDFVLIFWEIVYWIAPL